MFTPFSSSEYVAMDDPELSQTLSARYYQPNKRPRLEGSALDRSGEDLVIVDHPGAFGSSDRGKKRGRPKIVVADEAPADRRAQVRHAQRTYRLKKEGMFQDMSDRVSELESAMGRISNSLSSFYMMAIESDLHITHPYLFHRLNSTMAHVKGAARSAPSTDAINIDIPIRNTERPKRPFLDASNIFTFGYGANSPDKPIKPTPKPPTPQSLISQPKSHPKTRREVPLHLEKPLNSNSTYSHNHQDPTFSRRLQRFCLEYMHRLFIDPRSNPQEFYRVFRLLPCIRYKDKMTPYMQCLIRAGPTDSLEVTAVPFYCIGGAGTHYPRLGKDGAAIYPENMRLPRRILGTMGGLEGEGDDREALLKSLGLGGTWLDCHDVQGYLQEKGLVLDGSCLFAVGSWGEAEGISDDVETDLDEKVREKPSPKFHKSEQILGKKSSGHFSLDLEDFFRSLIAHMILLGRAPGFRLGDVEAAFRSAVRVSSG